MGNKAYKSMSAQVLVKYCGSWGYYSKFALVQNALKQKYTDLAVAGELVPGSTGSFEVILKKNGQEQLVHSKLKGEGIVNQMSLEAFLEKFDKAYLSL